MGMLNRFRSRHAEYWRAYYAVAAGEAAGTVIPLQSKRVHQTQFTVGVIQEVPAVFTVFAAAASTLRGEHDAAGYAPLSPVPPC